MLTLVIFLGVISILIFVHELGHFLMAKRAGMKVEEFGFGFPPRLFGKRYRGTLYSINAIPFGGFVRIFGEQGENRREPGSFGNGTFGQKMAVIVAGVTMNFLFAVFLLMLGNFLGLRVGVFDADTLARARDIKTEILQVEPGGPADQAGLQPLDEIVALNEPDGSPSAFGLDPESVRNYAFFYAGKDVSITVRRGDTEMTVPLHLRQPVSSQQGPIGISLALTGVVQYPWYESIWRGVANGASLFVATLAGYWNLLTSLFLDGHLAGDISGPIGIATLTGQAARIGFNYLLQFVAMISINLAVLNILPFPALDGGRGAIIIAEKLRGKALSQRVESAINSIGFAILLTLMVAVTIKDIVKFF